MAKWLWIVAGPNGAGKSTFAEKFLTDLGHSNLHKLNADERTLELRRQFPKLPLGDVNMRAAKAFRSRWRDLRRRCQTLRV